MTITTTTNKQTNKVCAGGGFGLLLTQLSGRKPSHWQSAAIDIKPPWPFFTTLTSLSESSLPLNSGLPPH
ncbi:hypothetical protein BaRGS_00038855, partial [Batillaria attramentaria]